MDQLSPARPGAATRAEEVKPPKAAPKADPVPAPAPPAAAETEARPNWRTRALMFGMPLALALAGGAWWLLSGGSVSTDNAYVQMDKVSVAAEVGGLITEVAVDEGELVKKGQLLFRIDPQPYALTVAQASAAIASARVDVGNLNASLAATNVDIKAAEEDIAFAQSRFERQAALMAKGFTTKADYDAAKHAVEQARARLGQARADAAEARARLATGGSGTNPEVEAARVQRAQAEVNLGRTEVRAPSGGRVAESDRLQIGQMMVAGLPAVTLVDTEHPRVEANFKETDLADMCVGQPAEMTFDAYPGLKVRGHVETIGAGTGSEFSVLPAQNATGNWVKVTQRVPVRIAFDEVPSRAMIAGLSTDVKVITSGGCK
ncbi:HlyD family secretion protein [Sphingopyxis indica]|uniref:Membrane fusion protein, multidrug efflux system n=1 Tax=Sphingopyxis indica TaxID=436663 RepID=A0A239L9D6_9SPHN|nr:HlyD family secretion protein [Sphingopyxis indica]SNT27226.1 membrane fusion protein, multidrug efflux system [Sphingopyxis indica]